MIGDLPFFFNRPTQPRFQRRGCMKGKHETFLPACTMQFVQKYHCEKTAIGCRKEELPFATRLSISCILGQRMPGSKLG